MKDENCIFCKIAAGEIPGAKLYEDDLFRVVLDLGPANKGHCLVIPKDHYANVFEMPEEVAGKAFIVAKRIATKMQEVTGCDGVNILQNNGPAAGQTVFHFHMHIIPRWENDPEMITWKPGELTDEVKTELVAAFQA